MSTGTHVRFEDGATAPVDLIDDSVLTTLLMPWSPEQGPGNDAPFNVSDDDRASWDRTGRPEVLGDSVRTTSREALCVPEASRSLAVDRAPAGSSGRATH